MILRPTSTQPPTRLAELALRLFGGVVVLYGLSGIVLPDLWLHGSALLHLPPFGEDVRATFLSEFRFLHARELGVGLYALLLHDAILRTRSLNILFLVVAFAGPMARLYSCLVDGASNPMWLAFMAVELTMSSALFFLTRSARRG